MFPGYRLTEQTSEEQYKGCIHGGVRAWGTHCEMPMSFGIWMQDHGYHVSVMLQNAREQADIVVMLVAHDVRVMRATRHHGLVHRQRVFEV